MKEIATDRRFQIAIRLARVVNAFRFCHRAVVELHDEGESPSNNRQRNQAFLFTCGLLHEALRVADDVARELRDSEASRERFVPFLRERAVRQIRKHDLRLLRNKVVFHFDDDVIASTVPRLTDGPIEVLDAVGPARADIYFPFADQVAVGFVLNQQVDRSGVDSESLPARLRMEQLIRDVTQFQLRFCDAAEAVITEVFSDLGLSGGLRK